MYSFLNPSGNKLVVVKVTILVTLLRHVVILGYNFVETLKVRLTLNSLNCWLFGDDCCGVASQPPVFRFFLAVLRFDFRLIVW